MKNIKSLIIGALIIIILGLACAQNTHAATGKYVKSISEIVPEGEYILEAVEFPNVKSGKAFASGGYGLFVLRRVG